MTNTDMPIGKMSATARGVRHQPRPVPAAPVTTAVTPGQRKTRQRTLIADVLASTDQLLTAQQVHRLLIGRGETVGLATVYRTLTAMAEAGEVDTVRTGQEWSYRRCSPTHHHHLTCRNCGRTVEITAPPLEQWATAVALEHHYTGAEHVIEISGVCPSCRSQDGHALHEH